MLKVTLCSLCKVRNGVGAKKLESIMKGTMGHKNSLILFLP